MEKYVPGTIDEYLEDISIKKFCEENNRKTL